MTRIRIRCRPPESTRFVERIANLGDVEVYAVADDGAETPLTNVDRVEFSVGADCEPARVVVTFIQPEIDVEGVADTAAASPFSALAEAFGVVGRLLATPCDCGHMSGQHRDEDRTCRHCDCVGYFTAADWLGCGHRRGWCGCWGPA